MSFNDAPIGEETQTESQTHKQPPVHKSSASFVVSSDLHQLLRKSLPADVTDYLVTDSFDADFLPEGPYAILLTTSDWMAGENTQSGYQPYTEFSLKIRAVDEDGKIEDSVPPVALSISVVPQYDDSVYPDGESFTCPFGEGARIKIQTTGAETSEAFVRRTAKLLEGAVGYSIDDSDIREESTRVLTVEATHRFGSEKLGSVVETLRDTESLITAAEGPVEAYRSYDGHGHLEARVTSERFDRLGLPSGGHEVTLKTYTCNNPETDSIIKEPRIEAQLSPDGNPYPDFETYEELLYRVRSIVCSHCYWAGVEPNDIRPSGDPLYEGVPDFEWSHPKNRKEQLRNHYQSIITEVKREALKPNTMSVYEILCTILKHPGCSYERLEEETGLSYSTVTYHVGRLAKKGILHRLKGAIAYIDFTSKDLRNRVETALRGLYPGGTDTEESHQQPEKQQTTSIQNKEISGDNTISVAESSYSPNEVARQLQQGTLSPDNLLIKEPPPDQSS